MHKFVCSLFAAILAFFPNIILISLVCIYFQCGPTTKCELLPWSKLSTFGKFMLCIWKHWCIIYGVSNLPLPLCTQAFSWSSSLEERSQRLSQLHPHSPAGVCHNTSCSDILNNLPEEMSYYLLQDHFKLLNPSLFYFFETVLLWSPGWVGTHCVVETGFKLTVSLLPQLPEC